MGEYGTSCMECDGGRMAVTDDRLGNTSARFTNPASAVKMAAGCKVVSSSRPASTPLFLASGTRIDSSRLAQVPNLAGGTRSDSSRLAQVPNGVVPSGCPARRPLGLIPFTAPTANESPCPQAHGTFVELESC